jgi:hypothetical protein
MVNQGAPGGGALVIRKEAFPLWEDLEEAWNYDLLLHQHHDQADGARQRYEALYPYAYPMLYPVTHTPYTIPSPRRLCRRWESGWY